MSVHRAWVVLLALCLAACGSAPPGSENVEASEVYEVFVLPDGFVRFEGERIPEELFLLKMRKVLRTVPRDAEKRPGLIIRAEKSSGVTAKELERFYRRAFPDLGSFGIGPLELRGS